jgi:hypothetical protein
MTLPRATGKDVGGRAKPGHDTGARLAAARTTSGTYSAANWVNDRHVRMQARRGRLLVAAIKLGGYVPPEVAARLAVVPAELRAPVHPSQIPYLEIATKTLGSGGPDVPGRCAAGAFSAPRVRAAELAAARAERAALAPWRAAIAAARLAKREALAARRAARMGKHDKDPMPMGRLPGAGLGARAAGIAAATEAGGAGTAARMGKHDKDPVARLPGAGLGARAARIAAATQAGGAGTAARMGKHDKDPMPMERLPGTGLGARAAGVAAATARRPAADGEAGVGGGKAQAAPVKKHGHGLLQRGAVAAGGSARMGKHDKDPVPMERLPGTGLGARAAGVAAATEARGAGTVGADAILAALPNRAARRRWKSLQRRKHPALQHPSAPPIAARGWPDQVRP